MSDVMESTSLEENILTMLVYDNDHVHDILLNIDPDSFSTEPFRVIARASADFVQRYNTVPGKSHIRDILEPQLRRRTDTAEQLRVYLDAMQSVWDAGVNASYVMDNLNRFMAEQQMRTAAEGALQALDAGDLEAARVKMHEAESLRQTESVGIRFDRYHIHEATAFLTDPRVDRFSTGIDVLDARSAVPARGEQMCLIAPAKSGKSWFCTHVGKTNMLRYRKKVLHVTLENSEGMTARRYVQSMLGMTVSETRSVLRRTNIRRDPDENFAGIDFTSLAVDDDKVISYDRKVQLEQRLHSILLSRPRMIIKEFPTRTLTMSMFDSYLSRLEKTEGFVPDLVIVDYPDLMKTDDRNPRVSLGNLFKDLRGSAGRRNYAQIVVTQGNRQSAKAHIVGSHMVAEDWSKIGTADIVMTLNRTDEEKERNLARIFVANGRNQEDGYMALLVQLYQLGQFCLDSVFFGKEVEEYVEGMQNATDNKPTPSAPRQRTLIPVDDETDDD